MLHVYLQNCRFRYLHSVIKSYDNKEGGVIIISRKFPELVAPSSNLVTRLGWVGTRKHQSE